MADVQAYVDLGMTDVTFMPYETDISEQVALLETLGEEVRPSF